MKEKDINSQINIKLAIVDIFPSLEEINNNNTEYVTISFQNNDNDIKFNLSDLFPHKKEIDLSYVKKPSYIKTVINKNNNIYASGLLPLKNSEQWITMSFENKKRENNSNFAQSLMDCIKLKINCKIIGNESTNNNIDNNTNNIPKKNIVVLNQKRKPIKKKININQIFTESINVEENRKSNRYLDSNLKISSPDSYTTMNKNNIKKIELPGMRTSKYNSKNFNKNYTNIKNEDLKNASLSLHSNSKKSLKVVGKKNGCENPILTTEVKNLKNIGETKRNFEELTQLNLNSKRNNKHRSYNQKKIEKHHSNKYLKKRKSGGIRQINYIGNLYTTTTYKTNTFNSKNDKAKNNKKEKNNYVKKKSNDNNNFLMISNNEAEIRNLTCSSEMYSDNNGRILNIMNENRQKNNILDNNDNIISQEIGNIQGENIMLNQENYINDNLLILNEENMDNDIFSKQLEDFKLLYSDEYIKSINNDYMKLEIELFIEKVIELTTAYNKQIEEKNLEYQIFCNNYYKSICQYIEIQKLYNKLNIIKSQFELKKFDLKKIKTSNFNNAFNNLITNKQQIKIFRENFIEEISRKTDHKKEILKYIVIKLIDNEKYKNILNKNEKYQIWIKNNCNVDKKKKEIISNNQKLNLKKGITIHSNNLNHINNSNKILLNQGPNIIFGKNKDHKKSKNQRKNRSKK